MLRKAGIGLLIVCGLGAALGWTSRVDAQTPSPTQRSVLVTPPQGSIYGSPDGSEATREVANRIRRTRQYDQPPVNAEPAAQSPRVIQSRMPGKPAQPAIEPPVAQQPIQSPATLPSSNGFVARDDFGDEPATIDAAIPANELPTADQPVEDPYSGLQNPYAEQPITQQPSAVTPSLPRAAEMADDSRNDNLVLMSKGPSLRVETFGPRSIVLGKPARYRVSLINEGDMDGDDAVVRIALPDWVEVAGGDSTLGETQRQPDGAGGARIVWTIGRIAAKSRENLDLQLVPRKNQMIDMKVDWTFLPASQTAQIAVRQPQLNLTVEGPEEIQYGDTATYTLTLNNPGTGDAENVAIDVSTAQGAVQTRQIGVIAAGAKEVIELELFARDAGALTINALATGDGGLKSDAAKKIIVRRAALQLQVRGSEYKYAGSLGEYVIRVSNIGDAPATNVALAALLPRGAEYVGGVEGAEGGKGRVDWKVNSLAAGAHRDYLIRCTLEAAGTHKFQVQATADDDLSTTGDCETIVETVADLKLSVNDPKGPVPVGKDVVYEVRVVNRGSRAAEDVKVIAQFSNGIEPVSYEGGDAEMITGQVLFKPVRSLGPGETLVLKIFARASQGGNHRFRTEVTCADQETQLVFEDTTKYFVSKTLQPADPAATGATTSDAFDSPQTARPVSSSGGSYDAGLPPLGGQR